MDTNVLLLLIAGTTAPSAVGGKRLSSFDSIDFDIVYGLAANVERHVSTPHILAEASNFLGSGKQQLFDGASAALARYVRGLDEIYLPARQIVATDEYSVLGLTDAGILQVAEAKIQVVTVDFHLCNRLQSKGIEATNLRHLRPI